MEDKDKKTASEEIKITVEDAKESFETEILEGARGDIEKEEIKLAKQEEKIESEIQKEEQKIDKLEETKEKFEEKEEEVEEKIKVEKENIEKLQKEEKRIKKTEKKIEKKKEEIDESEKEIVFDLQKIKNIFKSKDKIKSKIKDSNIPNYLSAAWQFILKNKMLFLILIPIFFSIWFRAYPIYLPITDDWAQDSVYNSIRGNIATQVGTQFPNLPDIKKNELVNQQFDEVLKQQGDEIQKQIDSTSQYFKSRLQDEDGQTYLLAIDPWLWYGYARNYIEYGHWGNEIINDSSWYTLRNGREGQKAGFRFMTYLEVINYKLMNIFGDFSVLAAAFYLPLVLITIAAFAAFFIAKKYGSYAGAITASIIVGIHAALLNRTAAGFSDTDNIIAFFELLTVMIFVLAFEEKERKKQYVLIGLAGLSMGVYSIGHSSWWHMFDFILGAWGIYLLYCIWQNRSELKNGILEFIKIKKIQYMLKLGIGFILSTWIFGTIIATWIGRPVIGAIMEIITTPLLGPLSFIKLKNVAITTIWPNVLTTVAELNRGSITSVISQIGGKFLFFLSLIGILYLFFKKEKNERKYLFYGLLLTLWYIGAIYAAQSSIRFTAFLVPAFALSIGALVKFIYEDCSNWASKEIGINKIVIKSVAILLIMVLVFMPLLKGADATGKREVPSMNDAWYDSLIGIQEASDDAIITSWWDFGHWFVAVAERRVTFDGGDQGERIHWVGKSLLTNDEKLSVGILRMLNCGQEKAPHGLEKYLDNDTVKAIEILNNIMIEDKENAAKILEEESLNQDEINEVLAVTHCEDLIDQYYITSDDMVGKAGVWGHFGSWDFKKASMYNQVKGKSNTEGIKILKEKFNLSEEDAGSTYYDIKTIGADQWVAPWPGYLGTSGCSVNGNEVVCGNGVKVNLNDYSTELTVQGGTGVPYSLVYVDGNDIVEKKFENSQIGVSVALIPNGNSYKSVLMDPAHATGMFTRMFFFEGHGLECFDLFSYKRSFTGNEIYVWKVDWNCTSPAVVDKFNPVKETQKITLEDINITQNITNSTPKIRKIV